MFERPQLQKNNFQPAFGAQIVKEGLTRFVLWAPGARRVDVEVEGLPSVTMDQADDGRATAEVACSTMRTMSRAA